MQADHIKPWSKGGKTELSNCQMLCKWHNEHIGKKSHIYGLDQLETYYTIKHLCGERLRVSIYQNHCFVISHIFPNEWALNMAIARYLR